MRPHSLRFFGGIGVVFLVYVPLRLLESHGAIYFMCCYIGLSYSLGWLMDRSDDEKDSIERKFDEGMRR